MSNLTATTVSAPSTETAPSGFIWEAKHEPTIIFDHGKVIGLERQATLVQFSVTVQSVEKTGNYAKNEGKTPHTVAICQINSEHLSEVFLAKLLHEFGDGEKPNVWQNDDGTYSIKLTPGFSCVMREDGSIFQYCTPQPAHKRIHFRQVDLPDVGTQVTVVITVKQGDEGDVTYLWVKPEKITQSKRRVTPATPKPVQRELVVTHAPSVAIPATTRPAPLVTKPKPAQQTVAHQLRLQDQRLPMPRPKTLDGTTQGEETLLNLLMSY